MQHGGLASSLTYQHAHSCVFLQGFIGILQSPQQPSRHNTNHTFLMRNNSSMINIVIFLFVRKVSLTVFPFSSFILWVGIVRIVRMLIALSQPLSANPAILIVIIVIYVKSDLVILSCHSMILASSYCMGFQNFVVSNVSCRCMVSYAVIVTAVAILKTYVVSNVKIPILNHLSEFRMLLCLCFR